LKQDWGLSPAIEARLAALEAKESTTRGPEAQVPKPSFKPLPVSALALASKVQGAGGLAHHDDGKGHKRQGGSNSHLSAAGGAKDVDDDSAAVHAAQAAMAAGASAEEIASAATLAVADAEEVRTQEDEREAAEAHMRSIVAQQAEADGADADESMADDADNAVVDHAAATTDTDGGEELTLQQANDGPTSLADWRLNYKASHPKLSAAIVEQKGSSEDRGGGAQQRQRIVARQEIAVKADVKTKEGREAAAKRKLREAEWKVQALAGDDLDKLASASASKEKAVEEAAMAAAAVVESKALAAEKTVMDGRIAEESQEENQVAGEASESATSEEAVEEEAGQEKQMDVQKALDTIRRASASQVRRAAVEVEHQDADADGHWYGLVSQAWTGDEVASDKS